MEEEKSVLRLGGLGGLLAGVVTIIGIVIFASFGGPGTTEEALRRVQEIGRGYLVVHGLGMIGSLLALTLFLALYRALRKVGPATALLGGVLGVAGALFGAASWAIILVRLPAMSDIYAAATEAEKPMVLFAAQASGLITQGFQVFGGLLIALAFVSFGWALLARRDVPRGYGWASLVLGLVSTASLLIAVGIGGEPMVLLFIPFLATLSLYFLLGWRVYSLSKAAEEEVVS